MKVGITHADTCLPDYWSGHHLAHVQILAIPGMSIRDIREAIKDELRQGAVMGSCDLAFLLSADCVGTEREKDAEQAVRAAYAAVNRLRPARENQRLFFTDIEPCEDDEFHVYAYFIFSEH